MSEAFKPIRDNVLVKRIETGGEKTVGGIIIPDTAKEKPSEGIVTAIGAGKRNKAGALIPSILKVGDKVIFEKWGGKEVKIGGMEYVVISEEEILAVIEK